MPFNTTGASPSSSFLSMPRACVKAAFLGDDDRPIGAFRDIGAVSSASVNFSIEEAEHYTSCGEVRTRDARIITDLTADLTMEMDHLLVTENLELLMSGKSINSTAVAQNSDLTGVLYVPNPHATSPLGDGVALGRQYKLWISGGNVYAGTDPTGLQVDLDGTGVGAVGTAAKWLPGANIYGVDASAITIEANSGTGYQGQGGGAAFTVAGGDFTVNAVQGTIFIPSTGDLADHINTIGLANVGQPMLAIALEYAGSGATITSPAKIPIVQALARASRPVALYFEQQDTARPGYRKVTMIHKVRLTPNGEVPLVSDGTDFATATIEGGVEKPAWKDDTTGNEGFFDVHEIKEV